MLNKAFIYLAAVTSFVALAQADTSDKKYSSYNQICELKMKRKLGPGRLQTQRLSTVSLNGLSKPRYPSGMTFLVTTRPFPYLGTASNAYVNIFPTPDAVNETTKEVLKAGVVISFDNSEASAVEKLGYQLEHRFNIPNELFFNFDNEWYTVIENHKIRLRCKFRMDE